MVLTLGLWSDAGIGAYGVTRLKLFCGTRILCLMLLYS